MPATAPLIVVHRRNNISQISDFHKGFWVEIDIEIYENKAYLTHDPITGGACLPELFEDFVPAALARGVAGFVVDCKRECAEKWVKPVFDKLNVTDYFYLNEMEVQADIFQSSDASHSTGLRLWKYRGAADIIRMAEDLKADGQNYPKWLWVDCWQRGLLTDITKAHIPLTVDEANKLHDLGIKLCLCSPELYVHKYDTEYQPKELVAFFRGMLSYRNRLAEAGIACDAVCTKFPRLWVEPVENLIKTIDIML